MLCVDSCRHFTWLTLWTWFLFPWWSTWTHSWGGEAKPEPKPHSFVCHFRVTHKAVREQAKIPTVQRACACVYQLVLCITLYWGGYWQGHHDTILWYPNLLQYCGISQYYYSFSNDSNFYYSIKALNSPLQFYIIKDLYLVSVYQHFKYHILVISYDTPCLFHLQKI